MEKITIDKAYYEFLVEKAKERCELYSENNFLRYKLAQKEAAVLADMNREEWLIYKDYIANNWFYLPDSEKQDEIKLAGIMYNRSEAQKTALKAFQAQRKLLKEE